MTTNEVENRAKFCAEIHERSNVQKLLKIKPSSVAGKKSDTRRLYQISQKTQVASNDM